MSKKIKVLIFTIWYPDENQPGNGVFIEEQAKALSNDCLLKVIHVIDKSRHKPSVGINDQIRNGIDVYRAYYIRTNIPFISFIFASIAAIMAFRAIFRTGYKPDIIHSHVFNSSFPALVIGKLINIPVVITEHFSYFVTGELKGRAKLKAKLTLNNADVVISVSDYLKEYILKLGVKNRIKVIPNLVNMENIKITHRPSGHRLICVGNYTHGKGHDILLKALKIIKFKGIQFHLDLIGDGESSIYEEMAEKYGIRDDITFYGPMPHDEVIEKMISSTLFVLPTRSETFGVVFIEAMACGLPIIGTDISPIKDIVPDFAGKLIPPNNFEALANRIESVLKNIESYSSEKISSYAKNHFSADIIVERILSLYNEIIQKI